MDFKNIDNYLNLNINLNKTNENINKPKLITPGAKYFFNHVLSNCNKFKKNNNNTVYNICMFLLFFLILGVILFIKYKGPKNSIEVYQKNLRDKQYIMSKLIYYNKANIEENQKIKNNLITNLPDYGNHPEASLLHKKIYS